MTREDGPVVFVLVPVHNRREITLRFVDTLLAQTQERWRLVLLDDGSTDGTAEAVKVKLPGVTVLRGDGSWWWAGALQHGFEWVRANAAADDVVLILNDDTELPPDFIAAGVSALAPRTLVSAIAEDDQTGAVLDAGQRIDWKRLRFEPAAGREVECASTRGLFLRAGDLRRLGGFHPRLLPHYLSDYEFTIRARRLGFRIATHPAVRLRMNRRTTGDHHPPSSLREVLRRSFTLRSAYNPLVWTSFVALASPWPWKPLGMARVWVGFAANLLHALRGRE